MDDNFIDSFPHKCDIAIATENINKIDEAIDNLNNIEKFIDSDDKLTHLYYCYANLFSAKAKFLNEDISLWRKSKFPTNLVKSLNYMRKAYSYSIKCESFLLYEIQTNLGNSLRNYNRNIEALYYYTFNYDYNLGMDSQYVAPFNKAEILMFIKNYSDDESCNLLYSFEAFKIIQQLTINKDKISHSGIADSIENIPWVKELVNWGENNQNECDKYKNDLNIINNIESKEFAYRSWCADHNLFLNPLNDITKEPLSFIDSICFPSYIVKIGEGPYLSSAFSDIKNRFCKSRYLLYCALKDSFPDWVEKDLNLSALYEREDFSTNSEFIKFSYKLCFSILDSLSTLISYYFGLEKNKSYFTPKWFRENCQNINNPFLDTLYWLACDLTDIDPDSTIWNAPNPHAGILRKMRNALEHKWVRLSEERNNTWLGEHDYAIVCTTEELTVATFEVFRYVRSAIIYFIWAVKYNELDKYKKISTKMMPSIETPNYNPI